MRASYARADPRSCSELLQGDPANQLAPGGRHTDAFVHSTAAPFCIGHGLLELHDCVQTWIPGDGMLNERQLPDMHCELSVHES